MSISWSKKQRELSKQNGKTLVAFGIDGKCSQLSKIGSCEISILVNDEAANEMLNAITEIYKKYKKNHEKD